MWWSGIERIVASAALDGVGRQGDAFGAADRNGLAQARLDERPGVGVGAVFAERQAGQRVDVGERHQHEEFLP